MQFISLRKRKLVRKLSESSLFSAVTLNSNVL
jgi:hypothetical protein